MNIIEEARITSKGQVTIPKRIRDRLGLDAGTDVEFVLTDEGELTVRPKQPAMDQLREIKATIASHHDEIDLDELRRRSKREWGSLDDTDLGGNA